MQRVDLLQVFGIDSGPGRMVTRLLMTLLLFQPVYIAMGMEIEETDPNMPVVTEDATNKEEPEMQEEDTQTQEEQSDDESGTETSSQSENEETTEKIDDTEADTEAEAEEVLEEKQETDSEDEETQIDTDSQESGAEQETEETEENIETDEESTIQAEDDTDENAEENTETDTNNEETVTGDDTEDDTEDDTATDDNEEAVNEEMEEGETDTEETKDDTSDAEHNGDVAGDTDTSSGGGGGDSNDDESTPNEDSDDTDVSHDESSDDSDITDDEDAEQNDDTTLITDEIDDTTATSPEDTLLDGEEERNIAQNPTNKYVFGEGDCTLVSDGEFYCVAEGPERQQMTGDPRVYAQKDREGDKEIYYFDGIEVKRITNNSYDDFAPMYDEETRRIVWQSMISDRLQIMVHELPTDVTRQVTTSPQNSSNPNISGDTLVWQEWIETNWEIMMTDVDNNGQEFEIEQLTDNAIHDMFPAAYDDLITWQSERGSSWEVIVYDMHTGKEHALEKDEDTKYENPRFVLLFDSKHENGDVETVGYDLDTGEIMELGTKSTQLPHEPVTPKDETPEAVYREATNTVQNKVEGDEDADGENDDTVTL